MQCFILPKHYSIHSRSNISTPNPAPDIRGHLLKCTLHLLFQANGGTGPDERETNLKLVYEQAMHCAHKQLLCFWTRDEQHISPQDTSDVWYALGTTPAQ